jgi:hypothetical protein
MNKYVFVLTVHNSNNFALAVPETVQKEIVRALAGADFNPKNISFADNLESSYIQPVYEMNIIKNNFRFFMKHIEPHINNLLKKRGLVVRLHSCKTSSM